MSNSADLPTTALASEDAVTIPLAPPVFSGPKTEHSGDSIGRYRLIEVIGTGGMGLVWRAEMTEPIRREVALKVIKPGMDSHEIISRFETERQTLALMDHPNIAGVLDAGTTESGRPFFVMELVKGVPITDYCDAHQFTIRQRLELFIPVCQAVQHAHQKAILHRDLKPSNILVTEVDGKPVPKVIDFGIAKALAPSLDAVLGDTLLPTQSGIVLGTPQYMSPEQAGAAPDIDTRSDIYTLGVILYELLVGDTPISREDLKKAALDEMLRLIREGEARRPSSRFTPATELAKTTALMRHSEPMKLGHALRGDLDWIVLKALEKDRARRYDTTNDFALDLRRHLDDEPVSAGPPSAGYRLKKLVRRNRLAFRAAAAILGMLAAGITVSTWQAVRATKAEKLAEGRRQEAEEQTKKANVALAREAKTRMQLQARLHDIVCMQRLSESLVNKSEMTFPMRASKRANYPENSVRAALFLDSKTLLLAMGSEVRFLDLKHLAETKRIQFPEPILGLFASGEHDSFLVLARGIGQSRACNIYRVPSAGQGEAECLFSCADIKDLAGPVAFACGVKPGQLLIAFGYFGQGSLDFEGTLPGNPTEAPDRALLAGKRLGVFSLDPLARTYALEQTSGNFVEGPWFKAAVREGVEMAFPAFRWSNADLDPDLCQKIMDSLAAAKLGKKLLPLAVQPDGTALVFEPSATWDEDLLSGIPPEKLRLRKLNTATLTPLPALEPSQSALSLPRGIASGSICDARSMTYVSAGLSKAQVTEKPIYLAAFHEGNYNAVGITQLPECDRLFYETLRSGEEGRYADATRDILNHLKQSKPARLVRFQQGSDPDSQDVDLSGTGSSLHVGFGGQIVFYVGRFRDFQGVLVYDAENGALLHRIDEVMIDLNGADAMGESCMLDDGTLQVAIQSGLLKVWRETSGRWTYRLSPR